MDDVVKKMREYREASFKNTDFNLSFQSVFKEWFQSISYRIKESTAANYTLKADKHILPGFWTQNIGKITQSSIHQFIRNKQDAGLSSRYITDILTLMKSVFKFAARTYHIFNPLKQLKKY